MRQYKQHKQHKQSNAKTLWGGGVILWPLFSLAVTPLVLATPAHATEDNTVSIAVDQNAALKPAGNLYKATTNVTVKTGKPYGFNLTMQADTSDLVNSKDSTHKISATPSSTPITLNANQWGYSLNKSATTFSAVPAGTQAIPAVVADVTKAKPAGCTNPANCTKSVTFAANVDPLNLASGSYSTTITYTATAKPKPAFTDWGQRTAKTNPSEVCRSGDDNSSCLVDIDKNMIPVKYTGTTTNAQWTSISNPEDEDAKGNWYDYGKKQWANAITVKPEALSKYQGQNKVVEQADILGFWVYIPRYAYEVMRRDGTDKPVKEQNFDIKFENTKTPKKRPLACKTGNGKDYRTECGVSRELPLTGGEVSTWSTHPVFTFGSKELNGIWFAKFETTGDVSNPTVLPNSLHLSGYYSGIDGIGSFYSVAKSLGVNDPQNVGGKSVSSPQNSHHLAQLSSHMVNSNDWGAATYLSASKYGAGYNGVQINSQNQSQSNSCSVTGCGPQASGNTSAYSDGGTLGTQQACSSSDPQRAYNGTLGQLASTTNNSTGIYDMSGGAWEYTAGTYTTNLNESGVSSEYGDYFGAKAHPPYVNTYNFGAPNGCTFATCGGQALYETLGWNGQRTDTLDSTYVWFVRGLAAGHGSSAGVFALYLNAGSTNDSRHAFRVALTPAPHD